jgi:hypothetical protein
MTALEVCLLVRRPRHLRALSDAAPSQRQSTPAEEARTRAYTTLVRGPLPGKYDGLLKPQTDRRSSAPGRGEQRREATVRRCDTPPVAIRPLPRPGFPPDRVSPAWRSEALKSPSTAASLATWKSQATVAPNSAAGRLQLEREGARSAAAQAALAETLRCGSY